ncbi:hypothetical protein [Streptomyces sp. NBC_01190]|uniref:hypothetical protein n=1 Tax=Streptomyces sp. NBC_01190 TaxID=2903767 RepID=UPI003869917D|nr:hypothetical protein OG519_31840 [Streptomyces sp. NBC_01190]
MTSVEFLDGDLPGPETAELPIADYKHLSRLAVESHSRGLDQEQLALLLRYERRHRDRTPVIQFLTARLRQFRRKAAQPPGGYGPAPRGRDF